MAEVPERRRVPRVRVPGRLSGRALGILNIRLVDLSMAGARIEHSDSLRPGSAWPLELPVMLGALVLSVRVIWSTVIGGQQTPEGERSLRYQSGLAFPGLTAEERAGLASILERLTTHGNVLEEIAQ